MKKLAVLLFAVATAACGNPWLPTDATTDSETFVVAETTRVSTLMGQKVKGEISTRFYEVKCADGSPCHATGWYVGGYGHGASGTAYYYQTDVAKYTYQILTGLAVHEVCHSLTGAPHDAAHRDCTIRYNDGHPS